MTSSALRRTAKASILRVCKTTGLFRLSRRFARRKLLILCYHGFELVDEAAFRAGLFMPRDRFAARLRILQRGGFNVIALGEALERLQHNTLPDNSICLTIDDGFYSVLACAVPLLRQYQFPATLYVTSYYASKGTPIFRLVIQYMFWKSAARTLDVGDQPWGLPGQLDIIDPQTRQRIMWKAIEFGETECDEPGRQDICRTLASRLGVDYQAIEHDRRLGLLTPAEIGQLRDAGIDVQLHTHRHRLPTDDEAMVRREISENARFLEGILGYPATHLCYPSGVWHRSQWPWLADMGIQSATTCDTGFNTRDTPIFGLYRVLDDNRVSDLDFEAEVCGFSELVRVATGRRRKLEAVRKASHEAVAVPGSP